MKKGAQGPLFFWMQTRSECIQVFRVHPSRLVVEQTGLALSTYPPVTALPNRYLHDRALSSMHSDAAVRLCPPRH